MTGASLLGLLPSLGNATGMIVIAGCGSFRVEEELAVFLGPADTRDVDGMIFLGPVETGEGDGLTFLGLAETCDVAGLTFLVRVMNCVVVVMIIFGGSFTGDDDDAETTGGALADEVTELNGGLDFVDLAWMVELLA